MAGTVYATREGKVPVQGARVAMKDATGATFVAETNCAGNFFVRPQTWRPVFPLTTTVTYKEQTQIMESKIHREASCGACHGKVPSPTSAGPIFLFDDVTPVPSDLPGGCK
ncbi:MAG: hypothetical protein JNL79_02180 [Myxococcales bacterium]|nr:hypothetical protein [Myxococcales bacterium]